MTIADTSAATVGRLFFSQFKNVTLATVKKNSAYRNELGRILEVYAPESSRLYRQKFAVYR
ncbi:hypothetical protein HYY72_04560 [Candidatus Woesearchaeota archaeon]|nr:hypothetical protein [Candidatus Woesearchaeota archaeon]